MVAIIIESKVQWTEWSYRFSIEIFSIDDNNEQPAD